MNRCWMLSTLAFGSFIALGRNIRVTLEQAPMKDYFHTVPVNEKLSLRRILSEEEFGKDPIRFNFIYFDEDGLAKERYLYRSGTEEITEAMEALLSQANQIVGPKENPSAIGTFSSSPSKPKLFPTHLRGEEQITRVQSDMIVLGLSYFLTGNSEYAEAAVQLIRTAFLNPSSQITPQAFLQESNAHVRGHVYQLLDAIKMVKSYLERNEIPTLDQWFTEYSTLLEHTRRELASCSNYTGLYFDIEDMAVSNFIGDEPRQAQIWKKSLERLVLYVAKDDTLPQEISRSNCEHSQMYALQGWWTLSRMFANAMGESLWTAEREAICRASAYAIPYLNNRNKCSPGEVVDDQRWWPIIVETLRHCPSLQSKRLTWREWMTPNSRDIPSDLYAMPLKYPYETGIAPFWNFGMPVKKTEIPAEDEVKSVINDSSKQSDKKSSSSNLSKLQIPAKLAKAAEQDAEMALRVNRIKRWHALGQVDIADRMMKKAIKDLKATKIVWKPKDFIPQAMLDAAKEDKQLSERIGRIRRWHALGQTSIVERMIKKSMDELSLDAEDDASLTLNGGTDEKTTYLRTEKQEPTNQATEKSTGSIPKFVMDSELTVARPTVVEGTRSDSAPSSSTESSSSFNPDAKPTTISEIPESLIQQSQNDPELAKRIHRIKRWKKLGKHDIANKMIAKLLASTEDQLF